MKFKTFLILLLALVPLSLLSLSGYASERKPLIVVGDANFPPVEYIEDGRIKGFNTEIWQELSKAMNRPVEIQLMLWKDAQQKVLNGEADALTLLGRTEKREKLYDFSEPTLTFEFCFFVRSDDPPIETINDLKGRTIGVTKGGYAREVLEPNKDIKLLFIKNNLEGFRLLISRKIDAVGTDKWVGAFTIQKHQIKGINIVKKPFANSNASIPVKKGNLKLLNEINNGIKKLKKDNAIQKILDKWSPKEVVFLTKERINRIITIVVTAFLIAVIVFSLLWIILLKRQVNTKIKELRQEIEERKQAEDELRKNEAELFAIYNHSPIIMLLVDEDRRILKANRLALESTVRQHNEIEGLRGGEALKCIHAFDDPDGCGFGVDCKKCVVRNTVLDSIKTGSRHNNVEAPVQLDLGNGVIDLFFLVSTIPLNVAGSKTVLVCLENITELKGTEEVLRKSKARLAESNQLLAGVLEYTHMMAVFLDPQFNFIWVNRAYADTCRHEPSFFQGKNHFDLYPQEENQAIFQRVVRKGESFFVSAKPFKFPDQPERGVTYWDWSLIPIKDGMGKVTGLVFTLAEVTDRIRAEEALRESETKYRFLFENMLNGFAYCKILLDENNQPIDFVYLEVNDSFEKLTGLRKEDVVGKKVTVAIPAIKDTHPELFDIYGKVALTGEETVFDIYFEPLEIWLSISVYSPQKGYFVAIIENISERKQAEEALRESEEKYRTILESIEEAYFEVDITGNFTFFNDSLSKYLGYSNDELLGMNNRDYMSPETSKKIYNLFNQIYRTGNPIKKVIYEIIRKDGSRAFHELSASLKKNQEGQPIGFRGIGHDVTEFKKAQEALRASEQQLEGIIDSVMDHMSMIDEQHNIVWVNDVAKRLFGPDLIGKKCYTAYHRRDRVCDSCIVAKSFANDKMHEHETEVIRADGKKRVFCCTANVAARYEDGRPRLVMEVSRDITERKLAEQSLYEAEAELKHTFEVVPGIIAKANAHTGYFTHCNPALSKILGFSSEEFLARPFIEFVHPNDRQSTINEVEKQLKGSPVAKFENRYICKDGSYKWLEWRATAADEKGVVYAAATDIAERKKVEEDLRQSREQLRNLSKYLQSSREQERTSIAREIHDELGQNLTGLKMDVSWLKKNLPKDLKSQAKKLRSMMKLINETIKTTKTLISQLRPGLLDDLGLVAAIEWQAEDFQDRTGIKTEVVFGSEEIDLSDEVSTSLFRIFQEAITNIVRHAAATEITASLKEKDGTIELMVRDNGKGITKGQISNNRSFGLLGMRERAHVLGGKVEITGVRGKGTTLMVSIPIGELL